MSEGKANAVQQEETGQVLRDNNEQIVKYLNWLRKQRNDFEFLIHRQVMEKAKIENEIEKLTFKLTLLCRSMNQRIIGRAGYERTITEIEDKYAALVAASGELLDIVSKEAKGLEDVMDKNVGTSQPGSKTNLTQPSMTQPSATQPSMSQPSISQQSQRATSRPLAASSQEQGMQEGADAASIESPNEKAEGEEQPSNVANQPSAAVNDKASLSSSKDHPRTPSISSKEQRPSYAIQGALVDRLFGEHDAPSSQVVVGDTQPEALSVTSTNSLMIANMKDELDAQNKKLVMLTPIKPKSSLNSEVSVSMFGEAYSRQHSSQVPLAMDKAKQTKQGRDIRRPNKNQNKNFTGNKNQMDE